MAYLENFYLECWHDRIFATLYLYVSVYLRFIQHTQNFVRITHKQKNKQFYEIAIIPLGHLSKVYFVCWFRWENKKHISSALYCVLVGFFFLLYSTIKLLFCQKIFRNIGFFFCCRYTETCRQTSRIQFLSNFNKKKNHLRIKIFFINR